MFQNGSQVSKDIVANSIVSKNTETIPIADPSILAPLAGGLTYDPVTGALYYGNGTAWIQVEQGTVSSIAQGTGIVCTPNPIVDTGIVTLSDTAVTPGTYGNATNVSQVTIDQKGRITSAVDIPIPTPVSAGSAQAYLSAPSQAIPDVTPTIVLFDASEYPVLATQPRFIYAAGVFTCTEAGLYLVNACCVWDNFIGTMQLALRKNASDNILTDLIESNISTNKGQQIVGAVSFEVGDTASVLVTRSGGGGLSILSGYAAVGPDSRGTQIAFVKI